MSEIKLKPCPFCGEPARLIPETRSNPAEVVCGSDHNCPTTRATAYVVQWNTRPLEDSDRQLIRELCEALETLEWSGVDYEEGGTNFGPACPSCLGHRDGSGYNWHEPGGHRKNCKLSAALQKARAAGVEPGKEQGRG